MKKSTKILTTVCATFLLSGSMMVIAMPQGEKGLERMTEYLQLNEEQASQVKQIFQEQREQTQARLQTVLTAEQFQKLKDRRQGKHHNHCHKQSQ